MAGLKFENWLTKKIFFSKNVLNCVLYFRFCAYNIVKKDADSPPASGLPNTQAIIEIIDFKMRKMKIF